MAHIELPPGLHGIAGPLACVGPLTVRTMTSAQGACRTPRSHLLTTVLRRLSGGSMRRVATKRG